MAATPPKPGQQPSPSVEELRRQIRQERDGLVLGLDKLAAEVGEAVDTARSRSAAVAKKARTYAPAAAGALAALFAARTIVRRRRRHR
jgi:hypothetical protein